MLTLRTCDNLLECRAHRLNATGYSLGATFSPNWMDWPMFYHGNQVIAEIEYGVFSSHEF